jgi:hypothetical protein
MAMVLMLALMSIAAAAIENEAMPDYVARMLNYEKSSASPQRSASAAAYQSAREVESAIRKPRKEESGDEMYEERFVRNSNGSVMFSGVFTNHTVLQRGPESSAVYGFITGKADAATEVMVTVADMGESAVSYSVDAKVVLAPAGLNYSATWKAILKPASAGGSFDITATCTGCEEDGVSTLQDVTFGGE